VDEANMLARAICFRIFDAGRTHPGAGCFGGDTKQHRAVRPENRLSLKERGGLPVAEVREYAASPVTTARRWALSEGRVAGRFAEFGQARLDQGSSGAARPEQTNWPPAYLGRREKRKNGRKKNRALWFRRRR